MLSISLRIDKEEHELINQYAKANNISVSELLRESVLEKIEDEIDIKIYEEAMKEHLKNPANISFEEMYEKING